MRRARPRFSALLLCLVFASLELLSSAPGFHRHDRWLSAAPRPSAAAAANRAARTTPDVALPDELGQEAPGDCPACTFSGLAAVVPCAIPVSAPATRPRFTPALGVRAVASPVVASLRGRAPPSA